ncbi:hypothetical protein [Polynucleobacter rarus]|uniref:hypothetical protein n=1 Tax=Polynucleobacter rarus TaxID=556055 RepID=UPI000D3E73E1|nr:hypothetical protein [Polynucleobacter rarus]
MNNCLPKYKFIKNRSGIDRYGFSNVLASRLGLRYAPRSFADWVHGWFWWDSVNSEIMGFEKYRRDLSIVVQNEVHKNLLIQEGFTNVTAGGLPFSYVPQQHDLRNNNSLLAYPPHSAESEILTNNQEKYFDYLLSLKKDFESIYVSIHYLDINKPIYHLALKMGLNVIQGANPADANSLLRVRFMLDKFKYVTSNCMGSHMLYALYSGCSFSFSGPFYSYEETIYLTNNNFHNHSLNRIEHSLKVSNELYIKNKFPQFFKDHPKNGLQNLDYAKEEIGEKYKLNPNEIKKALGWSVYGQLSGYSSGIIRRSKRLLPSFKL